MKQETATRKIKGQVIYCGPALPLLGLHYGAIFRDGVHRRLEEAITECPALGGLFVPVGRYAAVRRELNFDLARNMRGTTGKHVAFYHEVKNWSGRKKVVSPTSGNQSPGVVTRLVTK